MRIQHNIMALNAYRQLGGNNSALAKNLEKLSSGYRINRAGDDAAGLAISEKMRAQIKGLEAAQKNANDGISLVQTAEGALTEVHSMLNRMVYLATQSANGTYDNEVDRANLDKEVQTLKEEINRISQSTNFNGIKLLDGSMDSAVKTVNNKVSDKFKIADWVGTTANADAIVGEGTIVHTDAKEAKGTQFSVEFNNATVSSADGVSIQLGENEKMTLDNTEIAAGASAEEIAEAFAKKYSEVDILSKDGNKVKFDVKADGDRLVFTQQGEPKDASEVVNGDMTIKYEGIGGAATEAGDRLNLSNPTVSVSKPPTNPAKTATTTFAWGGANVTDEQKDALNKLLADGVDLAVTAHYEGTPKLDNATLDISKLTKALGDGYEVVVKGKAGTALTPDANGVVTDTDAAPAFTIEIKDKTSAETIGTISLGAITADGTGAANTTYNATVKIGAGDNTVMNTNPAISVTDGGNLNGGSLFAFDAGITAAQQDALNKLLADGDQTITLNYSGLANNQATNASKLHGTLSQGLIDAGYYLADSTTNPDTTGKHDAATGKTSAGNGGAADDTLYLYDKDNNLVATITTNSKNGTNLTEDDAVISLGQTGFNAETKLGDAVDEAKVLMDFAPATPTDGGQPSNAAGIDWTSTTAGTAPTLRDGDKFTFNINGKDYTVEVKNNMTAEEKASGKYIDTTALADTAAKTMLDAMAAALNVQVAAEAATAAKGTSDYVEVSNIRLTGSAGNAGRIDIKADTTKHVYVGNNKPADGGEGGEVVGGRDPNASTVNIQAGNAASDGRLASTYITAEDLAGLKDGSQLKVGDTVYTFAVGKDSKVTGDNVIDLTDMEASDAELLETALKRLTETGNPNSMFSIGYDGTRVTFTENKDYTWGEGVDLSTHDGIAEQFGFYTDGMSTTINGKALSLQVGDTADDYQKVGLDIKDMSTEGLDIADIDIKTQESAAAAIDKIKTAINTVSSQRGDLGAIQNRLEHTINNLGVQTENITAAESRIRDTDMAEEMMAYTKNNILIQAAQAMLAQANQVPQGILQLLQ